MLKEDYLISITGKQKYDSDDTEVTVNTVGSYTTRKGIRYIAYKEYDEENPNISRTAIIKVENNEKVTMSKTGCATRLILQKGQRHSCLYDTDFGQLQMGVFTSELKNDLSDDGGKLKINYTLDINSSLSSKNELFVEVSTARKEL